MYQVDNAIIMAAGVSSRFAPLSYEMPKALVRVKGEILIERQIRQLQQAGIQEIIIVVGYQKEKLLYLKKKYGVFLIENNEYQTRNNHYSLFLAQQYIRNTYICSADNYFQQNPFEKEVECAYYASVYQCGKSDEWCLQVDQHDCIQSVVVGGNDCWVMLGHVFFDEHFSKQFIQLLNACVHKQSTASLLWESIYMQHMDVLSMKIRRYDASEIFEFDSLDELREFDSTYVHHTGSSIMADIAKQLACDEADIVHIVPLSGKTGTLGVQFLFKEHAYAYHYDRRKVEMQ